MKINIFTFFKSSSGSFWCTEKKSWGKLNRESRKSFWNMCWATLWLPQESAYSFNSTNSLAKFQIDIPSLFTKSLANTGFGPLRFGSGRFWGWFRLTGFKAKAAFSQNVQLVICFEVFNRTSRPFPSELVGYVVHESSHWLPCANLTTFLAVFWLPFSIEGVMHSKIVP